MKLFILVALVALSIPSWAAKLETNVAPVTSPIADSSAFAPVTTLVASVNKLNFLQRLKHAWAAKKVKKGSAEQADRQARGAFTFGIIALSSLLVGLFVPYLVLAVIPTAVVAMVQGKQALKNGTNEESKARLGKTFGLVSLITLGALLLLAVILVAAWSGW